VKSGQIGDPQTEILLWSH